MDNVGNGSPSLTNGTGDNQTADNDDELNEFVRRFYYIVSGLTTVGVVGVGVALNGIAIVAFLRPYPPIRRPSIYYYLLTLAIWDTLLLIFATLLYGFPLAYYRSLPMRGNNYVYLYPVFFTASNVTLVGSAWIVMTLTVDRYFALCKPITHKHIGKRSRVKKLLLLVSFIAVLYGLPRSFEVTVLLVPSNVTDYDGSPIIELQPLVSVSPIGHSNEYKFIYKVGCGLVFHSLVPFCLLFFITVRITIELRRAGRTRRSMSASRCVFSFFDDYF